MEARAKVEGILDPGHFGLPEVARYLAVGREAVPREGGEPSRLFDADEISATLCDFVVAFRLALLELADQIDSFQNSH